MVPGEPRQPGAIWAHSRRRVEIIPRYQYLTRSFIALEFDADQSVYCFAISNSVVLPNANQSSTRLINNRVGIANVRGGSNRLRRSFPSPDIESLVGKVGKVNDSVSDRIISSPILMHESTGVEGRRRYIVYDASRIPFHYDAAPTFSRPHFNPINVRSINQWLRQPN